MVNYDTMIEELVELVSEMPGRINDINTELAIHINHNVEEFIMPMLQNAYPRKDSRPNWNEIKEMVWNIREGVNLYGIDHDVSARVQNQLKDILSEIADICESIADTTKDDVPSMMWSKIRMACAQSIAVYIQKKFPIYTSDQALEDAHLKIDEGVPLWVMIGVKILEAYSKECE